MALTRKFLTALGIEADKIEEIITAHTETVGALKEQINESKVDANTLESLKNDLENKKQELSEAKDKIKTLEADDNDWEQKSSEWEQKYNNLKSEYDNFKSDAEAKETKNAKSNAYRKLLKEAGVSEKRIDSVLKVSNIDNITLDKDGNVEGADKLIESVKSEWSDFIPTTSEKGAEVAKPPANTGGTTMTKEDIMAIKDRAERQKAIAENPSVFGIVEE